jgi:hypothetical protein
VNPVEAAMLNFVKSRHEAGVLSVTAPEVLDALVPSGDPKLRYRPAYKYGLDRLLRRGVLNARETPDGVRHYFVGDSPSEALLHARGLRY